MIAWLKDFFGLQDIRRDTANMHHKPYVVREEDRRRYTVSPGPPEIPEDLKRIAKWQPVELKRMSDKIIADVVEPLLLREKENCRMEKALEFSRGYEEGKMAERERCSGISDLWQSWCGRDGYDAQEYASGDIAKRIRSGE